MYETENEKRAASGETTRMAESNYLLLYGPRIENNENLGKHLKKVVCVNFNCGNLS